MSTKRLILASTSPRRAQLLTEAGYAFEQVSPPFDDTHYPMSDLPPRLAVSGLAYLKMASVADSMQGQPAVILGCDTLVQLDDHALGKPTDADDARRMITSLSNREHQVATAVCICDAVSGRQEMLIDTTTVRLGPIPDIDGYIASGEWRGKAGGYNLGELRDRWPFEIIGDPTTVIGLPMQKLTPVLHRYLD
jgi:septum formation protein